ncbi:MAG: type II secretion system protein M [Deltaproteobacteria bacterium]|nr:type II secretion system protein M [Deltaproteobacteria bacterium]
MAIKLNKREKIGVAAAAAAIVIFLVLQVLIFPLFEKNAQLSKMLATRQQEREQILQLQTDYRKTAEKAEQAQRHLKTRQRGFTLFSFLETLAGQTGVKSHISYMRPTTTTLKDSPYRLSMVEMKLEEITMAQLLTYLHGIETSRDMISIKRLSISKGEQKADLINTVFQVETVEM